VLQGGLPFQGVARRKQEAERSQGVSTSAGIGNRKVMDMENQQTKQHRQSNPRAGTAKDFVRKEGRRPVPASRESLEALAQKFQRT
jgi:hypothetical protein